MILCYVDDVIATSSKPMLIIDGIKATFKLKGDKAEVPVMYLGGDIKQVETTSGTKCWTLSSENYMKTAIANVEEKLSKSNLRLPSKCITPFVSGYHPSEDMTKELDSEGTRYYQELIGVLDGRLRFGGLISCWKLHCCQLTLFSLAQVIFNSYIISLVTLRTHLGEGFILIQSILIFQRVDFRRLIGLIFTKMQVKIFLWICLNQGVGKSVFIALWMQVMHLIRRIGDLRLVY